MVKALSWPGSSLRVQSPERFGWTRDACVGLSVVSQALGHVLTVSVGRAPERCTMYTELSHLCRQPCNLWDRHDGWHLLRKQAQWGQLTCFMCIYICLVTQSYPALCDPMDCSSQAPLSVEVTRQEYWSGLLFPSPGESSRPRDWTRVSCIAGRFFTVWATRETLTCSIRCGWTWLMQNSNWKGQCLLFLFFFHFGHSPHDEFTDGEAWGSLGICVCGGVWVRSIEHNCLWHHGL